MREFYFEILHDDGRKYYFDRKFPNAFVADRWAMQIFRKWLTGMVTFRVVFLPGKEL